MVIRIHFSNVISLDIKSVIRIVLASFYFFSVVESVFIYGKFSVGSSLIRGITNLSFVLSTSIPVDKKHNREVEYELTAHDNSRVF